VARGLAELRSEESLHEIPGHFRADCASAHAENRHVIILDALSGGKMIVDETGANAFHLVGAHRCPDTAAADRDAAIHLARNHRFAKRDNIVGVIVARIQAVSTEVNYLMSRSADFGNQLFLQSESTVICGNAYAHADSFQLLVPTVAPFVNG